MNRGYPGVFQPPARDGRPSSGSLFAPFSNPLTTGSSAFTVFRLGVASPMHLVRSADPAARAATAKPGEHRWRDSSFSALAGRGKER